MNRILVLLSLLVLFGCKKNDNPTSKPIDQTTSKGKLKASLASAIPLQTWASDPIQYSIGTITPSISGGTTIAPTDANIHYTYVRKVVAANQAPGFVKGMAFDRGTTAYFNYLCSMTGVEFIFSGQSFEFYVWGNSGFVPINVFIEVDNKLTQDTGYVSPAFPDNKGRYIKVDFGASVSNKHIKLVIPGAVYFGGLVLQSGASIGAYTPPVPSKVVVIGDSYTFGTGTGYKSAKFYAYLLGRNMGWDNTIISGAGGTGYLNSGGFKNYRQRLPDVVDAKPDAVVITGGINDIKLFTPEQEGTEALAYFQAIRSALPDAEIFVIGPFYPSDVNYPSAFRDAIKDAASQVSGTHFVETQGWFTGTGNTSNPSGSGNADLYITSDKVHPNVAGHAYLAQKLSVELKSIINSY